ncbi:MAG: Ig-like domain repeat protein [Candidatus Nanopelagicales bacterium]|nr:Ig-like domain repeat protein [Candidatus Nanopelagicales bacterium]
MNILAAFRNRSLASFLSALLIASGLQFIAISSAPVAYAGPALSWVKSNIASQVVNKGVYGQSLATSADGSKVFVGATNRAFLSTDYGVTWSAITALTDRNVEGFQVGAAMSADGTKIYYAYKNEIWYSWNSGQTWTATQFGPNNGGPRIWSMDASDDGTKILITNRDSNRYSYSINSGQTWTSVSDIGGWAGAISGDGNKIIIADRGGTPRIGPLGGTLTAINLGTLNWKTKDFRGAACDFTCTNILLSNTGGGLFTSSDSGATWKLGTNSADSSFSNLQFEGAAINSDGTRMAATVSWDVRQDVYISTDFGNTWRTQNVGLTMPQDVEIASTTNAIYALSGGDQGGSHPVSFARSTFPTSSTSVLSANNYSPTYGQAVTLTATVQQGGATATTATGTVDFKNNGTSITSCSAKTVTAGIAQCSFTPESASTFSNITAVYSGDNSLSGSSAAAISITVSKANQATLTMANQSFWAHQNAYPNTWVPAAGGSGTGALQFNKISGPCTIVGGVLSGNPTGPSGPKVCTYTVTRAADTNYNATTSDEFTVTMAFSFSKIGLALPSGATTATYGTPVQITATSFGQIPGKITFRAGGQIISGCSDQSVTAAPWTTTCSWTPSQSGSISLTSDWVPLDTNTYDSKIDSHPYKLATDPTNTTTPVTISVNKIATNISIALNSPTSTYGSVNTITATASVPGSVTFKTNHFDPISYCTDVATTLTPPYTAQCDWFPITVATRPLSADLTPQDTAAYASSASNSVMTTSGKAQITITPTAGQSKRYGESNQAITYSITSGALVGSDTLSGSLTYTGTNVGSYTITRGTLTHTKYDITLAPEVFEITAATQSAVSLLSVSSTFNPANKTVLLSGAGGSSSGTYSFALDPSNATDGTDGCSVTGSTLTYTSVGICLVTVTRSSDSNFLTRSDVISVSIATATQTITFGSLSAKEYSGDTFTVSATSSASLPVVFTSVSQSVCTTSGNYGSTIKLLGVGTCVINANQIGDGNVAAASQVSQNFDVNPRTITVTADAKSKNYGTNDPTLTYSVTTGSLVLGDSLTGMLSRAAGSDAGNYQIQQGSLTTGNNPKYAINFVGADLTIDRVTPSLVLSYPNSNVAILRPGATVTPALTTSSSSGALSFATTSASSICTVDSATGVISLFGAGNCAIAMSTAQTTNFIAHTQTTTLTVALLSTSLVGIDPSDLISMGQPFYSHPVINQSYSFSSGSNGASVSIPAGTLDSSVPISVSLLTDSAEQRALIGGTGTSVLSVVVSWVASDGSVPNTNTGKAISVTLTNPEIKAGAKIYSIIGDRSQLLGTATVDGSVTTLITEDPVLLVINPVAIAQPVVNVPVVNVPVVNVPVVNVPVINPVALAETKKGDAIAVSAAKKIVPQLSIYSVSASPQLSAYDKANLKKYVAKLKPGTNVSCIGYVYGVGVSYTKATKLAKKQAGTICNLMKNYKKDLKTKVVIYDAKKAPRAAKGAKWVTVSFRIDGTTK